jgi:hypothetical protein
VTPAEAQAEIRAVAEELLAVEDRLRRVWEAVPRSPDEDEMFEGKMAWDVATALRVDLECVLEEQLQAVIRTLEKASRSTGEHLLEGWRERPS